MKRERNKIMLNILSELKVIMSNEFFKVVWQIMMIKHDFNQLYKNMHGFQFIDKQANFKEVKENRGIKSRQELG